MAKNKILFVSDKKAQAVCVAWTITIDPEKIARITKLSLQFVNNEIDRLWQAGILDLSKEHSDTGTVDSDVLAFIDTKVAKKVKAQSDADDDTDDSSEDSAHNKRHM